MKYLLALSILIQASLGFSKEAVQVTIASNFSGLSITSFNPFGGYFKDAVELAIFDNQTLLDKAGIDLKIHTVDYGSDDIKVIEKAKETINSKSIAVIGYNYSSPALLAAPVHSSGGLPMISPSASANRLGTFGKYVHLGSFSNRFMVQTLARVAVKELGKRKILILTAVNCAYCSDLASSFSEEIKFYGGEVVKNIGLLQEEKDFKKIADEAKKLTFDAIFVPNQELTAARLIVALTEAGIEKPFLGADGWGNEGPEFFRVLKGRKFTGYSVTHWHTKLNTPKTKKFVSDYLKKYQKLPNDTSVLAYDSMTLLIQSIVKTKPLTRDSLEKTLSQVKTFDGVTGKAFWEPHKAPRKDIVVLKTTDSGFAILKVLHPEKVVSRE